MTKRDRSKKRRARAESASDGGCLTATEANDTNDIFCWSSKNC